MCSYNFALIIIKLSILLQFNQWGPGIAYFKLPIW